MNNVRVIPLLHIKGPNVVKPIHNEALRIIGDPRDIAGRLYAEGADEIIYLDVVASLYGRNLDFDLLRSVTQKVFVPVTAGGGIRTIQDIKNALRAGADKVAVNTSAIRHPEFLSEAAKEFGSQCIVLYIEAKQQAGGAYEAYTDGGREHTGRDVCAWVREATVLGIGEILLSSIDRDGTRKGFDLELLANVSALSSVPIIAHGGAGSMQSVGEAVEKGAADAVALSSVFQYRDYTIAELKEYICKQQMPIRKHGKIACVASPQEATS